MHMSSFKYFRISIIKILDCYVIRISLCMYVISVLPSHEIIIIYIFGGAKR
jgi:hypothetical protein